MVSPTIAKSKSHLSKTAFASASSKKDDTVQVTVTSGPRDCKKPGEDLVAKDNFIGLHYRATVDESSQHGEKGKELDSSYKKGFAQGVAVGQGKVIPGLDIGLIGLCKRSKATLIIPPHLAYGDSGNPPHLPGGVTLKYEVEIVDVQPKSEPPPEPPNEFAKIDSNDDYKLSKKEVQDYFDKQNQPIDLERLFKDEDKNQDGYISWEEFTGSKGNQPPNPKKKKSSVND